MAREDVTAAALTGAYELKASLVAARAGDAVATWERWERAWVIGEEIGWDLNEPLAFGPSNVAIWSVALPVEMLDGAEAVRRAQQVNPVLGALVPAATIAPGRYSRERLSRHWIDVGRAYHYRADRGRALSSILEAERIAPQKTRINPAAREVSLTRSPPGFPCPCAWRPPDTHRRARAVVVRRPPPRPAARSATRLPARPAAAPPWRPPSHQPQPQQSPLFASRDLWPCPRFALGPTAMDPQCR